MYILSLLLVLFIRPVFAFGGLQVMEITFQFLLPNFKECWWDHWVLDMLVCNFPGILHALICAYVYISAVILISIWVLVSTPSRAPGMVLGLWICARLDVPRYSWMSTGRSKSKTSQAGGVWPYFSMFSSELYSWDVFTSPTRLFQVPVAAHSALCWGGRLGPD